MRTEVAATGNPRKFANMRVISGSARGRQIKAPPGLTTRPMTDRLKSSLFSVLTNLLYDPYRLQLLRGETVDSDTVEGASVDDDTVANEAAVLDDDSEEVTELTEEDGDESDVDDETEDEGAEASGWGRILDLYAGSGSLGIEAVSRGADWADFVEQNAGVCRLIRQNLETLGFAAQAEVHARAVDAYLAHPPAPARLNKYDIIFLDPPYADPRITATLDMIGRSDVITPGTLVVLGHSFRVEPGDSAADGILRRYYYRRMGDSAFSIFLCHDVPDDNADEGDV